MLLTHAVNRKVARAVVATSISQIVVVALSFVSSVGQARLLGAEGRGDLARFINDGGLIVLFLGLGLSSAITYFVASDLARPRALLRILWRAFVFSVLAVLASLVVVAQSPLERFLPQGMPTPWAVASLTAFFALTQSTAWVSAVLAARGDFRAINGSALLVGSGAAVLAIALLVTRPPWVGAWVFIAGAVLFEGMRTGMLTMSMLNSSSRSVERSAEAVVVAAGEVGLLSLIRYSGLTWLGDAMQFLTYRFDQWVVDAQRGAGELGRYALAVSLAQLVWIVPTATARVLFPYVAMLHRADGAVLAWRAARIALVVSGILGLVGWIGSLLFLTTLFGDEFAEVPALIGILLVGVVPYSVAKVLGNYLAAANALGIMISASGLVLVFTVALDLLLIPAIGATGAAVATAASYCVYTALLFAIFIRRSPSTLRAAMTNRGEVPGSSGQEDGHP